jgi:acyl carrier protein
VSDAAIEGRVKEIVAEQLGLGSEDVQSDARFSADLGADALDLVELAMALEEEFDLEISEDDAHELETVEKAVEYISRRQGGARADT